MKKAAAFLLLAGFALSAEAPPPHETGLVIPSAQSGDVLTDCIEKQTRSIRGDEQPLPGGGLSIQLLKYPGPPFSGHPTLYFDVSEADGNRNITIRYRHPMTKGAAAKWTRKVGRKCFPYELDAAGGGKLPAAGD